MIGLSPVCSARSCAWGGGIQASNLQQVTQGLSKKVTVQGRVFDSHNEPIIGASVRVKGTTTGAVTNLDGAFTVPNVPENAVIVISYLGCKPQELPANSGQFSRIVLLENNTQLDEIVVVGYGVQTKRDVSTSISQVKAEDIATLPAPDFRQSMAGKMPGVSIMQTSGDPEGNVMVRVRGASSVTAGNDPLYIIDGVPVDNGLSNLNSNDIESIEVLKDASSAAIYGSRGANGVIIITTKKGAEGKLRVSYDGYVGFDKLSKKIKLMNAYQYAQVVKDAHDAAYYDLHPGGTDTNGNRPESFSNYPIELEPYLRGVPGLTDTDWQDEIFRTGLTTSHNISLSGGSKNIDFFVSGNYYLKKGIIINSDYKKYSTRLNLNGKFGKFKFNVNLAPSYSNSQKVNASGSYGEGGVVQSALTYAPIWPVYNTDGSYNFQGNGYWRIGTDYQHNEILNPVALAYLQSNQIDRTSLVGKLSASYEIIKGLTFMTSIGGNYYGAQSAQYRSKKLPLLGKNYYDTESPGTGYNSASFYYNWLWENQLTYTTKFKGGHNLTAVLVQSAQKETVKSNSVTATNYPNDYIPTINGGTVSAGSSNIAEWSLASYLARVQYNYQGKYMLSAAIRADGSSRFGKDNRWGYFPSASAAWRLSTEPFFTNSVLSKMFDDIKLRASYGQTGNFQIGNYEHIALMAPDNYILGSGSGKLAYGYKPSGIDNPNLSWEKTAMFNVGVDLAMFHGYFGITAEYYNSNTTDMLLNVPVSNLTGYSTALMNIGKVNNYGFELTLTSRHTYENGLSYSFRANYATNKNKVKALGATNAPIITTGSVNHAYFITEVGKPIGSYYLLVQDGIFKDEESLKSYPHFANTKPGDFRFVDVDGDGVMDLDKDRAIVGNYMPDFTYGFGGDLSFKNVDFQISFSGVYGNEILNLNRRYIDNMEGNVNGTIAALNRWQSPEHPGDGNTNRANRKQTGYNGRTSTWHIEDGSYLRLQSVTLGYTLPQKLTKKFSVQRLRVYLSGLNLKTWTKYSGYNPEVSDSSSSLNAGEDYGTYPLATTVMGGINITF